MPCYRPLDGYRLESGSVSIGYEPKGSVGKLRLPCGRCFGCRMEYSQSWAIRLQHEAACWDHNQFVTLTYDDKNLSWHGGLEVSDLQRFLKRLRKAREGEKASPDGRFPIRYFAAGEYGSISGRAHWHIALFNVRIPRRRDESEELRRLWPHGLHTISDFSPARAGYIAGYATKKVRGKLERERRYGAVDVATGEWMERRPEFCVMSRRPGIGAYWFERYAADLRRGFVVERGGVKKRLPRFYLSKLKADDDFAMAHEERVDAYVSGLDPEESKPERLRARERVHAARVGATGRSRGL